MEGDLFNVVNIRMPLNNYDIPKKYRKLLAKNKKLFTYKINRATIDPDKERLYEVHKPDLKGLYTMTCISSSIQILLAVFFILMK